MADPSFEIQLYESDLKLMQFKTYEEYLDSLVTAVDLFYLESTTIAQKIARLGYLSAVKTFDEETFYDRREFVGNLLYPTHKIGMLASESTKPINGLQCELAVRERPNRLGSLSTIIFTHQSVKSGRIRSAFVDYAHRLTTEDWVPFFKGKEKLKIRSSDLYYLDSYLKHPVINRTENYNAFFDQRNRLVFHNLHDDKFLNLDPNKHCFGHVSSLKIQVKGFDLVILFDYVPRKKSEFHR